MLVSRPKSKAVREVKLNQTSLRTKSPKIRRFSDSQGRNVAREILRLSNRHSVSNIAKPGVKFEEVTKESSPTCSDLGNDDVAVLIGGTNDVAYNEADGLLRALKRRLVELRNTNVLVFSVPHRHDLPTWSCVNQKIKGVNCKVSNICKHFSNVKLVDLSTLGARFHTRHDLHLNAIGKKFIADSVLSFVGGS